MDYESFIKDIAEDLKESGTTPEDLGVIFSYVSKDISDKIRDVTANQTVKSLHVEEIPEVNFGVMVPREDYNAAITVLNRAGIKPKTQFHAEEMAVLGFDAKGDLGAELELDNILDILDNAGIASVEATGDDLLRPPLDGTDLNERSEEYLKEASEIIRSELSSKENKVLQEFEDIMSKFSEARLKLITLWSGGKGKIAAFEAMNRIENGRFDTVLLKKLAGLKGVRWMEVTPGGIDLGFE